MRRPEVRSACHHIEAVRVPAPERRSRKSMSDELASFDATAQAELVRSGEASPRELVDAAIARIEALNPTLNAVITERFDAARGEAAAGARDGPFRGVPFLLKDLACPMAG